MFRHTASYILFGIGICGLLFALARTYYLVWKMKKEREKRNSLRAIREAHLPEEDPEKRV